MSPTERLAQISADLKAGKSVAPVTVRQFLSWFGAQRRGYFIVHGIRQHLRKAGIATVPDFESAYIDSLVGFAPLPKEAAKEQAVRPADADASPALEEETIAGREDPTYRVSKLAAANQQVAAIKPDAPFKEAVTIMMAADYSQLPVMTTARDVKGVISWKSIGERLGLGVSGDRVADFMDAAEEVPDHASMFEAIPRIIKADYVLVRGEDRTVKGIVTASDLSQQFRSLSEPFLLLSEIENLLRMMIDEKFTADELKGACDPADSREVKNVADLAFGEYIRLLENQDRWDKFGVPIDRSHFCKQLDNVRRIRNDVVHFDPDGISDDDLERLRDLTGFLKRLNALLATGRNKRVTGVAEVPRVA
jgi:predicted transcriptional regulator